MSRLRAYHNDPSIKASILTQLQNQYNADEITKGVYWENGKGCAIGCTTLIAQAPLLPPKEPLHE